ncbi:MAG: hypothetical protein ABSD21_13320 [Rhizomicrobium sp.]
MGIAATPFQPARGDDQPLLTLYTTDIGPSQEAELEQWFKWKSGHAGKSFNEFEYRSEFEYSFTDDLQGSLYLNYDWAQTTPHSPAAPTEIESFPGISGELIYRVMNSHFDPIGLAFYLEPSISAHERELEFKILAQKNFFHETLRSVININFEDRWEKDGIGHWNKDSALEFDFGSAYELTPEWSIGLELDNERGFDGLIIGGPASETANTFFIGPTIQYAGEPLTVSFGVQTQLPLSSNPSGIPGVLRNGYTADAEHFRMALHISTDL